MIYSIFKRIFSSEKKDPSISEQAKQTLDKGLEQTKTSFLSKLTKAVAGKSKVDDEVLDNLEEVLVTSDVGVATTLKIIKRIEERSADELVVLQAREREHPGLPQLGNRTHLRHGCGRIGRRAEKARRVRRIPERRIHERTVDAQRRVVGVDR